MKIIKERERNVSFNSKNRFIKVNDVWYEVVSIDIDIIQERITVSYNQGHLNEQGKFVPERKYRSNFKNRKSRFLNIKEKLDVDSKFRVTTSFKIADDKNILIFNENNRRIKYFKVIDDYTIEVKKIKSDKVDVKYKSKQEEKRGYDVLMKILCSRTSMGNNILGVLRRTLNSEEAEHEIKHSL